MVTATNVGGSASSSSQATVPVAALAPSNTTPPAVSGTVIDGQALAASTGAWSGTPPLEYAYQWQNCNSTGESCSNISGATSSTYVLGDSDVGTTVRVTVTATNSAGSDATSSEATILVAALAPSNTMLPEIAGTTQAGQTLTASTGTWDGTSPLSYTYQWQSCDSLGEACLDIADATTSSYTLASSDVGDTIRVVVSATNSAGSVSATSAASAVIAGSSGCTDTWTGEGGDSSWQTPGNWSTGSVPGPSNVACVGPGATVRITGGTNQAGSISDEGSLVISGGSLELASASQVSSVNSLSLNHATLSGSGSLNVSQSFTLGPHATMSGSGSTIVQPGVTGEIFASSGCEQMSLSAGRTLVNEGTLTFVWGTLFMAEGAGLENKGTFADNTESTCYGPQIQSPSGSGAAPSVLNTGTFEKTGGSGTSKVAVNFGNQGSVIAKTGILDFSDGGIPEEVATGSWKVQGGRAIVLSGGTFLIGEEVELAPSEVEVRAATVTRVRLGPPSSSLPPNISGEPFEGQTLSASTGSWGGKPPLSFSYQWQSCDETGGECADIAEATSQSYTLGSGEVGRTLRVLVTATNTLGSATADSQPTSAVSIPAPPANTMPPAISGTAQDGHTLSANTGAWAGAPSPTYTYQWQSCNSQGTSCTDISGATSSTYALGHGDVGITLRVRVEATNFAGSAASTSEATGAVVALAPSNTTPPVISGTPQDEQTLSVSTGEWEGTPPLTYSYQWESCDSLGEGCMDILGATSPTYVPEDGDVGSTLQVMVTATNSTGSSSSFSAVTAVVAPAPPANTVPPVISGPAQVGQTLSANTGSWTGVPPLTYAYQWRGCNSSGESCTDISGATSSTYVPGRGDVGSTLQIVVTATNAGGPTSSRQYGLTVCPACVVEEAGSPTLFVG